MQRQSHNFQFGGVVDQCVHGSVRTRHYHANLSSRKTPLLLVAWHIDTGMSHFGFFGGLLMKILVKPTYFFITWRKFVANWLVS